MTDEETPRHASHGTGACGGGRTGAGRGESEEVWGSCAHKGKKRATILARGVHPGHTPGGSAWRGEWRATMRGNSLYGIIGLIITIIIVVFLLRLLGVI